MKLKLRIMGVIASVLFMVSSASAACTFNEITLDSSVSGTWSSDCITPDNDAFESQYYTFTLTGTETIQIDLDAYTGTIMTLMYDPDANDTGSLLAVEGSDTSGPEPTNARIVYDSSAYTYLYGAGTYSIEVRALAETYNNEPKDFTLTLTDVTPIMENYTFKGTIDLPAVTLERLENCSGYDCPSVQFSANIFLSDGNVVWANAQVDYNDATGKYEYQFDVLAEANTSIGISPDIYSSSYDPVTGEYDGFSVSYAFGADQAVGGTGADADYIIGECDYSGGESLQVDLNTSLPTIEIDLSNYVAPIKSNAVMILNNVPANTIVNLRAQNDEYCGGGVSSFTPNGDGSATLEAQGLYDGYEYGLRLEIMDEYTYNTLGEYRLNDDDGDFTNGGVFVEDMVYDEFYTPVFDKTIIATSEDINISAPENLYSEKPANPALVPTIYLLLM